MLEEVSAAHVVVPVTDNVPVAETLLAESELSAVAPVTDNVPSLINDTVVSRVLTILYDSKKLRVPVEAMPCMTFATGASFEIVPLPLYLIYTSLPEVTTRLNTI